MRKLLVILSLSVIPIYSQAQSTTGLSEWWYFGYGAGLHFTDDTVLVDTSSSIQEQSGAITISDSFGNLQFYYGELPIGTERIWNRNHEPMPNGSGLLSDASAEQTTTAIPLPEQSNRYLVFTVANASFISTPLASNIGLFYHQVDMNLDNGLGDVVDSVKNVILIDSTSEKIAAVQHANGKDYWVMVQQCGTNKYHAFLVTENGVNSTPVTTSIGPVASNYGECSGVLRFSHRGDMLANYSGGYHLFDFDRAAGTLSNLRSFSSATAQETCEFSPDDTKLYAGFGMQFDISQPTGPAIQATGVPIYTTAGHAYGWQMGPDGRIYGINWNFSPNGYMAVINNPNEAGLACGYQDSAIYLQGRSADQNTPNFPSSFFHTDFAPTLGCPGDTAYFDINFHFIDSVMWNFGDPASGAANTSTAVEGKHVYNSQGSYTVTLIAQNGAVTDTVTKTIHIQPSVFPNLGADTGLCAGQSITLNGQVPNQHYQWSTGDTTETITVNTAGTYTITVTPDSGCAGTDAINIASYETPVFALGEDIYDCEQHVQAGITLNGPAGNYQYSWSSGGTAQNETVFSYGTYTLTVTNQDGCSYEDQIEVQPDTCLGVAEVSNQSFKVYPNPNDGSFILEPDHEHQATLIEVYSAQGVLVEQLTIKGKTAVDFRAFGAGVYYLKSEVDASRPVKVIVY